MGVSFQLQKLLIQRIDDLEDRVRDLESWVTETERVKAEVRRQLDWPTEQAPTAAARISLWRKALQSVRRRHQ